MKSALFLIVALTVLIGRTLGAEGPTLEEQFRADAKALILSKAQQPVQVEAQKKLVDQMVADVKKSFPSVLIEVPKEAAPTDDALRSTLAALDQIGTGAPRPVLISYYADLWKSERIEPRQRIIFERLAQAITQAAKSRKKNG